MNIWKINIPKSVIILTALAVVLSILRVIIFGKFSFIWILWNIFLAFIPFFISSILIIFYKEHRLNKLIFILGMFLWILFIPNSPYIITDFIHLGEIRSVPLLFDILLLFTSASIGLTLFFHSLSQIEELIQKKINNHFTTICVFIIVIFISFGIYLGRFLRFNSWDIFINHTSLIKNIWEIIRDAALHTEVYLYTGLFTLFLIVSYKAWKYSFNK